MSLAAFLRLTHPIVRTEWAKRTCSWVFEVQDGMEELVAAFQSGEARVDPVEYNSSFAQLKAESFEDVGVWEHGIVVFFNPDKGFGFVKRENSADDAPDVMFHIRSFDSDDAANLRLVNGDAVEFVSMTTPKGERCKVIRLAQMQQHTA